MNHNNRSSGLLPPFLFLALLLGGCDNRQEKAQSAYGQYQAAAVSGDLRAARRALATLVQVDDSNAEYWIELGKLCMQMADYAAAYDAFQRAHELNRANADVLAAMTQLALRSGNLDIASENAKQLELVAPTNPAIPLTKGYVALRRSDLDEADRQAVAFNEVAPYDPSGKVLQSSILMARGKQEEAIALLRSQIGQQPSDATSLRALAGIHELREEWTEAAAALRSYLTWQTADHEARVRLIEAQLRSGQTDAAADTTLKAIGNEDVDRLLGPWVAVGKQEAIADRLFAWAETADPGRRIAAARFLTTTAQPARVLELTRPYATLPVRPDNAVANALYATALAQSGQVREGVARLDEVIRLDAVNREALRARAVVRSRAGQHQQAVEDAQRLVSVDRNAAPSRLLLARIYAAAGDTQGARRTLWEAFHDLGVDRSIYDALRPLVARSDGPGAAQRLSQEYYDKRNQQLSRSFA